MASPRLILEDNSSGGADALTFCSDFSTREAHEGSRCKLSSSSDLTQHQHKQHHLSSHACVPQPTSSAAKQRDTCARVHATVAGLEATKRTNTNTEVSEEEGDGWEYMHAHTSAEGQGGVKECEEESGFEMVEPYQPSRFSRCTCQLSSARGCTAPSCVGACVNLGTHHRSTSKSKPTCTPCTKRDSTCSCGTFGGERAVSDSSWNYMNMSTTAEEGDARVLEIEPVNSNDGDGGEKQSPVKEENQWPQLPAGSVGGHISAIAFHLSRGYNGAREAAAGAKDSAELNTPQNMNTCAFTTSSLSSPPNPPPSLTAGSSSAHLRTDTNSAVRATRGQPLPPSVSRSIAALAVAMAADEVIRSRVSLLLPFAVERERKGADAHVHADGGEGMMGGDVARSHTPSRSSDMSDSWLDVVPPNVNVGADNSSKSLSQLVGGADGPLMYDSQPAHRRDSDSPISKKSECTRLSSPITPEIKLTERSSCPHSVEQRSHLGGSGDTNDSSATPTYTYTYTTATDPTPPSRSPYSRSNNDDVTLLTSKCAADVTAASTKLSPKICCGDAPCTIAFPSEGSNSTTPFCSKASSRVRSRTTAPHSGAASSQPSSSALTGLAPNGECGNNAPQPQRGGRTGDCEGCESAGVEEEKRDAGVFAWLSSVMDGYVLAGLAKAEAAASTCSREATPTRPDDAHVAEPPLSPPLTTAPPTCTAATTAASALSGVRSSCSHGTTADSLGDIFEQTTKVTHAFITAAAFVLNAALLLAAYTRGGGAPPSLATLNLSLDSPSPPCLILKEAIFIVREAWTLVAAQFA